MQKACISKSCLEMAKEDNRKKKKKKPKFHIVEPGAEEKNSWRRHSQVVEWGMEKGFFHSK